MPNNNENKNNENKNIQDNPKQDNRRPLPQGNIIGKRPEIFNLTYKNMYKEKDSN